MITFDTSTASAEESVRLVPCADPSPVQSLHALRRSVAILVAAIETDATYRAYKAGDGVLLWREHISPSLAEALELVR